jgi:acetyltransferase-like isoleucine patch superfamily enzyme
LRAAYYELDEASRKTLDRSHSLQDSLFSRTDRAQRLGFGEGSQVYNSAQIWGEIEVGRHCYVGMNTVLDGIGGLRIGSYSKILHATQIHTHDSVSYVLSGKQTPPYYAPVDIGEHCYLGVGCYVTLGVTIGDYCVLAPHTFVDADVPSRTIVGGSPARPLGRVRGTGLDVVLEPDNPGESRWLDAATRNEPMLVLDAHGVPRVP